MFKNIVHPTFPINLQRRRRKQDGGNKEGFPIPSNLYSLKMGRGLLIAFEGLDGVGKSTQIDILQSHLKATIFKFPDRQTKIGQILDLHLKKERILEPKVEHLLHCANRAEKESAIIENLLNEKTCLLDRYLGSGISYTSSKRAQDFNLENKEELIEWAKKGDAHLLEPDLTFYLKTSKPYLKNTNELYETPTFQKAVEKNFDILSKEKNWTEIQVDSFWKKESELASFLIEKIEIERQKSKDLPLKFNTL